MKKISDKKVDVCVCVKNRGNMIEHVIDNLEKQTFKDFNIIVCDGKSSDNTAVKLIELVNKYENIKIYQVEEDNSYIDSHNMALANATAEYVCWIDSDDVITEDKIEKQVKFLDEHKDVDVVTTGTIYSVNGKTAIMPNSIIDLTHEEISDLIDNQGYSLSDICHFQSAMFRRSCLKSFKNKKYFFKNYKDGRCGEGFMLALFYLGYKFNNIKDITYCHNLELNGITASNYGKHIYADEINERPNNNRKNIILKLINNSK